MSERQTSALLHGRSLTWSCYDPSGVVGTAIRRMLREQLRSEAVRPRLLVAGQPADVVSGSNDAKLGLAVWRLVSADELTAIGKAVLECCQCHPESVRLIYCQPSLQSQLTVLYEAGAQLIVSSVPSLQFVIRRIAPMLRLSDQGFHPLTSGLSNQLPLPEFDPALDRSSTSI